MQSGYILKTIIIGQNKKPDKSLTLMSDSLKDVLTFRVCIALLIFIRAN